MNKCSRQTAVGSRQRGVALAAGFFISLLLFRLCPAQNISFNASVDRTEVAVGEHVNILQQGESLHFNSGIRHKLKSVSDERAELIVVIYTP